MGLIFLIIVIIIVIKLIKLLQRDNSRSSNYSEDYRQGYWDGVRDAQNGCAKIEDDNGQIRLVTENQNAASRLANTPLTISKNENLDNIIPTSISTAEERGDTVAVPIENNIERAPHIDDKEKERGRKTTINIALYTASLLLTAGILLLAQAINLSIQLRFGLVWLFIFIYYIIGQILYARLPILKSTSTALIGTALAAIPIGGWTMNLLLGIDLAWCWLITSVIGAVLCVDATVRLNSRPLAYVSLLSMFTMTTSLPAVVHAQLVWYYVVMLLFGCLMTVAAYFSSRLPRQFVEPLNVVNPFIVPMTMFIALSSSAYMGTLDISVLLFASVAYYFTVALVEKSKKMRTYELTTARLLLMAMAASFAMYLSDDNQLVVSVILGLVALGNIIWSATSMYIQKQYDRHHEIVLWASFAVSLSALFGVIGSGDALRMMVAFTFIGVISAISLTILFFVTSCPLRCYGCDIWDSIGADWYNTIQY
jgi:membrane protein